MAFVYVPAAADNTASYDVESSSLPRYRDGIVDNIFQDNVILGKLKSKGSVVYQNGGQSIAIPVEYRENATVSTGDYYTTVDTTPQKISQTAEFQWATYRGSITISHKEKRQNAGDNVYNLYAAKSKNLAESMSGLMNQHLFASSQATTNDLLTLVTLIDETSTIGNINSTSQTFWGANATTGGSFGAQGMYDMETAYVEASASNRSQSPDLIVTTSAVFNYYKLALQPQQRYMSTSSADSGFQNLAFNGAEVCWDRDCTAGVMYFLNTNALKLYIDSGTDFIMTQPVQPTNQLAESALMAAMLQVVVLNRRRLSKITAITA